jgi:integrase
MQWRGPLCAAFATALDFITFTRSVPLRAGFLSSCASSTVFRRFRRAIRHACGFALANAGHDTRALQAYLGHRNITHTVRYTELARDRFKDFWQD